MKGKFEGRVLRWIRDSPPNENAILIKAKLLFFSPMIRWGACIVDKSVEGWQYYGPEKPVTVCSTNENGFFSIELVPGTYSVFVEYNGKSIINFLYDDYYPGGIEIKSGEIFSQDLIVVVYREKC